ncbi:hypothetical protein Tco_1094057 [Tanacetum coccineum]|uniref:Uncharacterized protein n=1 Tax=Tanacetum coccineum TaxID=301880 RepID=A0ABQ5IFT7_9ASTR
MNTTQAQQKALDDALIAPADHLEFKKCNMRLKTDIKPKEATFQVVLDALALTPFYQAFLITADFCPKIPRQKFEDLPLKHDILSFIRDLGRTGDITYLTDVNVDYLHQPWRAFATVINKCLSGKETGMDKIYMSHTQVYGTHLPKELTNQVMLESNAYKTYYAFASGEKTPKPKIKSKAKVSKSDKKKQPAKNPKAKGIAELSEVMELTLSQRFLMSNIVPDVPIYESESEKESWGDSEDEDNENNSDDISDEGDDDNNGNDGDDDDDDVNDDVKQEEEEYDDEFNIEEGENIDDEETMYDDEEDEVTKELYEDVNVNLGNEDTKMTNVDQGASKQQNVSQESGFEQVEEDAHVTLTPVLDTQKADEPVQISSVSSNFTSKLLNLENPSLADNEIASLMETSARHAMKVPENTSGFTTTIPPPPPFFNPLLQQATLTLTPTTSEATTSFPLLLDFSSIFRFTDRVTNLEKDLSEIKQVDHYAQALSSIPAIVDRYMDNKLREAINKSILAYNLDCRQEAQDEKNAYIELVDTSMRALIKEEFNTQLPQILPQAISDFANPVIKKNVTKSVEVTVLTRSSSQPTSTYKAAASLSEFELTKILIDKMEKNKSYDKADYNKKLYDALIESYNTDKDLFDSYGEVFLLKRSRDEKDKDRDPSTGSDRGTKRRKSIKDSAHAGEPIHTVKDSGMQQDQEFVMGDNDEQPADKETWISQVACAEQPPTSFDELNDTSFDFSAFVMNRIKILNLTQEILVGPAFNLLKGKCIMELEYHLEECSKATTERLDWHNPKNKLYLFDLKKLLPLIQDHRGRQIIPHDYFLNNDLEYLKGEDLSRRYSTSVTKTKAATYNLKWIEDLVPNLRSPVQVKYDQHAYLVTSHWSPNAKDSIDELHKFSDGTLDDVRSALNDIAKEIRMEYLPMRKWSNLDKKRARVMNRRDLPRDIPLDSVVVLRYEKRSKSENKGKVPTEMELVLEQTQQGTSYEVSVSAKGVEELKRKVKIKGEKKEALLTLRQKWVNTSAIKNHKDDC